jgi:hypothetical protein
MLRRSISLMKNRSYTLNGVQALSGLDQLIALAHYLSTLTVTHQKMIHHNLEDV